MESGDHRRIQAHRRLQPNELRWIPLRFIPASSAQLYATIGALKRFSGECHGVV
jgi:hypothetical protein